MIVVRRSAPLLTVQDSGRFGYRADGVTTSGPLDPVSHAVANGLVGNTTNAASLEGCLGGAVFAFERATTLALAGADVDATLDGAPMSAYVPMPVREGAEFVITRVVRGAVWYLAVRGGIDVPLVLGSRSTLVSAGLGGFNGEPIRAGATLPIGAVSGPLVSRAAPVPAGLRAPLGDEPIALTPATRTNALTDDEWRAFYESTFTVSRAISRTGYRLKGPTLPARLAADLASEPACAGAMQLPPEGQPIVLMADHPTVGGYPMIGVVPAHAIGHLAQRTPGTAVKFESETPADARARGAAQRDQFRDWLAGA